MKIMAEAPRKKAFSVKIQTQHQIYYRYSCAINCDFIYPSTLSIGICHG